MQTLNGLRWMCKRMYHLQTGMTEVCVRVGACVACGALYMCAPGLC